MVLYVKYFDHWRITVSACRVPLCCDGKAVGRYLLIRARYLTSHRWCGESVSTWLACGPYVMRRNCQTCHSVVRCRHSLSNSVSIWLVLHGFCRGVVPHLLFCDVIQQFRSQLQHHQFWCDADTRAAARRKLHVGNELRTNLVRSTKSCCKRVFSLVISCYWINIESGWNIRRLFSELYIGQWCHASDIWRQFGICL